MVPTSSFFQSGDAERRNSSGETGDYPIQGALEQADRLIAHPLFILRIAGEPIEAVAGLTPGATVNCLRKRAAAGDAAQLLSTSVCELLEGIYPRLTTREQKNALVAVKRDFYNLRSPRRKTLDLFLEPLAQAERAPIEAMLSALEDIAAAEDAAQVAYQDETQFIFRELNAALLEPQAEGCAAAEQSPPRRKVGSAICRADDVGAGQRIPEHGVVQLLPPDRAEDQSSVVVDLGCSWPVDGSTVRPGGRARLVVAANRTVRSRPGMG